MGPNLLNLNLRRLIVLFKTPNGYQPIVEDNNVIPPEGNEGNTTLMDPLESIKISQKRLIITLNYQQSAGTWSAVTNKLIYRYEKPSRRFRLIGRDYTDYMRNSFDATESSFNYLTGKRKMTFTQDLDKGEANYEKRRKKVKTKWLKIRDNKPIYLDSYLTKKE